MLEAVSGSRFTLPTLNGENDTDTISQRFFYLNFAISILNGQ